MSEHDMEPRVAKPRRESQAALGENPLESDLVLEETFYRAPEKPAAATPTTRVARDRAPTTSPNKPKPTHYKVVSISLYNEDIDRLEEMVAELKRRGFTKANKSQLIRFALETVDIDAMPRGYS